MRYPITQPSNDPIIRVERVSKRYHLGLTRHDAMRDRIAAGMQRFLSRAAVPEAPETELWALKDVSLDVQRSEVVGIIGRNGAGKSTLLKILSRITEPTDGRAEIRGRVGSLLEVGTGFHPELTGRENVYLNGAILGMTKAEITRKFDEIVDFAEIERFLDTPVKRYSSGMYVRLAFAVAAHLELEILIIDEVLGVGDVNFQKKCLGKMTDVTQSEGRTILFVSHNISTVSRICNRVILLDSGRKVMEGAAEDVTAAYLQSGWSQTSRREWSDAKTAPGDHVVRLRSVVLCSEQGDVSDTFDIRRPFGIRMEYEVLQGGQILVPNFHFFNEEGVYLFVGYDLDPTWRNRPRPRGRFVSSAWIPANVLAEGTLFVGVAMSSGDPRDYHFFERDAVAFQIKDDLEGDSARGEYHGWIPGVVRPLLRWDTTFSEP